MGKNDFNPSSSYMWNSWKKFVPVASPTVTYGTPLVQSTTRNLGNVSDTMASVLTNANTSFGSGLPKTSYSNSGSTTNAVTNTTGIPSANYGSTTTPTATATGNLGRALTAGEQKLITALGDNYSPLSQEVNATLMNSPDNYTFLDSAGNSFVDGSATNPQLDFYNTWKNDTTFGLSNGTWQGIGNVANLANMAYNGVMQYLNYRQAKKAAEEQKALNHANYTASAKAYNSKFRSGNYIGRAMVGAGYTDEMRQRDNAGLKEAMVAENY